MGAAYGFTVYVLLINYDVIKVVELCSETSVITYTKVRKYRRLLSEKFSRRKPKNTKANGKFFLIEFQVFNCQIIVDRQNPSSFSVFFYILSE
jgi:hypothetical protein